MTYGRLCGPVQRHRHHRLDARGMAEAALSLPIRYPLRLTLGETT